MRKKDLEFLYKQFKGKIQKKDDYLISYESVGEVDYKTFMHYWVQTFDQWMINKPLHFRKNHYKWRGINFNEFKHLFLVENEEEFALSVAHNALGITTQYKKKKLMLGLDYNYSDYIMLLEKRLPKRLLDFISNKTSKVATISQDSIFRHMGFFGGTGTGKTLLIASTLEQLFQRWKGYSFVVIDPHGDLVERLAKLNTIHDERVMYFSLKDFRDTNKIFSYNAFDIHQDDDLTLSNAIDKIVDAIKELPSEQGQDMSGSMANVLRLCLDFLFKTKDNPNIEQLYDLLMCEDYIYNEAKQFNRKDFSEHKFIKSERASREAVRRRVENALYSDIYKHILATDSSFNLREAVEGNKILLFNLKGLGKAGDPLGRFLISNIRNITNRREKNAPDLHHTILTVDEAHRFISKDYKKILGEERGHGLHFLIASQVPEEFGDQLRSIRNNVAVKIMHYDDVEHPKKLSRIEDRFLKKDQHGKPTHRLDLKRYEFLMVQSGYPTIKFKAPDYLLKRNDYYRSPEEQQEFLEKQYSRYYKEYKPQRNAPALQLKDLEELKIGGGEFEDFQPFDSEYNKDIRLLHDLAVYKFLTTDQMVALGISSSKTNLPTRKLEKDKQVKSIRSNVSLTDSKSIKVYFLSKEGMKYAKNTLNISPNYPTGAVRKLSQPEHKLTVIDFQIALQQFPLRFIHKDIDNSGIPNVKATRIAWNDGEDDCWLEPDLIFAIDVNGGEYYTLEYERLTDSKKSYQKVLDHIKMIEEQGFNQEYNFEKEWRSLFVFEERSVYDSVTNRLDNVNFNRERILFKVKEDGTDSVIENIYDGWTTQDHQKRKLFYL